MVAMAVAPGAKGYWLATRDGAVLRFGAVPLGRPDGHPPRLGRGRHGRHPRRQGLLAGHHQGQGGGLRRRPQLRVHDRALKASIVGIAPTANGKGYWLAARDGAVFAFGDAHQAVAGRPAAPKAQGRSVPSPSASTPATPGPGRPP